jgi:hypothetical protein
LAETARTDANGRYEIPAWFQAPSLRDLRFTSGGMDVNAFKPAYMALFTSESPSTASRILMKPFNGSTQEYFDSVLSNRLWSCAQPGSSGKNLYRLYIALTAEAQTKAVTSAQQGIA